MSKYIKNSDDDQKILAEGLHEYYEKDEKDGDEAIGQEAREVSTKVKTTLENHLGQEKNSADKFERVHWHQISLAEAERKIKDIYLDLRYGGDRSREAKALARTIPADFFDSPKMQEVVWGLINKSLTIDYSSGVMNQIMSFVKIVELPIPLIERIRHIPDIQIKIRLYLAHLSPDATKWLAIGRFFGIPHDVLMSIAIERCKVLVQDQFGDLDFLEQFMNILQFSQNTKLEIAKVGCMSVFQSNAGPTDMVKMFQRILKIFQATKLLDDSDIQESIKSVMVSYLEEGLLYEAVIFAEIARPALLQGQTIQDLVCDAIRAEFGKIIHHSGTFAFNIKLFYEYVKKLNVSDELFFPLAADAVALAFPLDIGRAVKIFEELKIPSNFLCTPQLQKIAHQALVSNLDGKTTVKYWPLIKKAFELTDEVLCTDETRDKFQQWIIRKVQKNEPFLPEIQSAREVFPFPDDIFQVEAIQTPIRKIIVKKLKTGSLRDIPDIQKVFAVPDFISQEPEVIEAVQQGMARWLSQAINGEDLQKIQEKAREIGEFCHLPLEAGFYTAIDNQLLLKPPQTDKAVALAAIFEVPFQLKDYLESAFGNKKWAVAVALGTLEECQELYRDFVATQKASATQRQTAEERRRAIEILSGLAQNGDKELAQGYMAIVFERGRQTQPSEDETGFDTTQETACMILQRMDGQGVNSALFQLLLNTNIPERVKESIAALLFDESRHFLYPETREAFRTWRAQSGDMPEWRDLQFVSALDTIPSKDLRARAKTHLAGGISSFFVENGEKPNIYDWASEHEHIPAEHLLLLTAFVGPVNEYDALYQKMTRLYTTIRKENSKKETLLGGLIAVLDTSSEIQALLHDTLQTIEFGEDKEDADRLAAVCQSIKFINDIEKIMEHRVEEEQYSEEMVEERYADRDEETLDGLFHQAQNLAQLQDFLEDFTLQKIQNVLPHRGITPTKIQAVQEAWNYDLEPIFTYLRRFPELKHYIAEMMVHMDSPEAWQAWRYNLFNETVNDQIGHLTEEQRLIWITPKAAELGDVLVAQSSVDKSTHICDLLTDAVVRDRHIFNPEAGFHSHEFIQTTVGNVFAEIQKDPSKKADIIKEHLTLLQERMRMMEEFGEITEDVRILEKAPLAIAQWRKSEGSKREKLTEAGIALEQLEPTIEQLQTIRSGHENSLQEYKKELDIVRKKWAAIRKGESNPERGRELQVHQQEEEKRLGVKIFGEQATVILDADKRFNQLRTLKPTPLRPEMQKVLEKYHLTVSNSEEMSAQKDTLVARLRQNGQALSAQLGVEEVTPKKLQSVIKECKVALDLLRLSNLNNRLIATNRIAETSDKKGETITSVLKNLKNFFKDSPLLQDIKNIEFTLQEEQKIAEKCRLALIATDDPQMVWQVGKYPLGNGSCQHYAEGAMAESLLGYVGDAHIQAVYLLNLNALPEEYQEVIKTEGVNDALTKKIPARHLLNSAVGRSIIKLTQEGPIFFEPTYSVLNKGDKNMDTYFNAFINLFYAEPMAVDIARGLGEIELHIPASRNPSGQYEDGSERNANNEGMGIQKRNYTIATKIINQNYVASHEEQAAIEYMRKSSVRNER